MGLGGNRLTEIRPGCPSGPQVPVESGLRVRRVCLCPSNGVPFVTRVVTREVGLVGDADPVVVAGEEQFDLDALHRGGVSDVKQCVDHVLLLPNHAVEILEVVSIWRDGRKRSHTIRDGCVDFVDD